MLSQFCRPLLARNGLSAVVDAAAGAVRLISSTQGSQLAEPALAPASEPVAAQQQPNTEGRWLRELGVIRTDWT